MKVRILADQLIDGLQYRCNQVVELSASVAKALIKDGQADDTKDAVAYCIDELGVKVIDHATASKTQADIDLEAAEAAAAAARVAFDAETDAAKKAELQQVVELADQAVAAAKAAIVG